MTLLGAHGFFRNAAGEIVQALETVVTTLDRVDNRGHSRRELS